jgi:translation initiation factor IF-1
MPCAKLRRVEGIVAGVIDGTSFAIHLSDGTVLTARISRRLALLKKCYVVGDEVLIGMLPHRRGDGLILTVSDRAAAARTSPRPRAGHAE